LPIRADEEIPKKNEIFPEFLRMLPPEGGQAGKLQGALIFLQKEQKCIIKSLHFFKKCRLFFVGALFANIYYNLAKGIQNRFFFQDKGNLIANNRIRFTVNIIRLRSH
jgi:hypothetical protein